MKTLALFIPFGIAVFLLGCVVGYMLHPEPLWDIGEDERACIVYWDDGIISYKSRIIHIGTLAPRELVEVMPLLNQ